jgi:hypothetical protein
MITPTATSAIDAHNSIFFAAITRMDTLKPPTSGPFRRQGEGEHSGVP